MTAPGVTALDSVAAQQAFRVVLEALARPGTPMALPRQTMESLAPAVVPVVALADPTIGVCVLENPGAGGRTPSPRPRRRRSGRLRWHAWWLR